MIVDALASF